ncbi:hypothetical protein Y11_26591 [Yersinia enterocolitica subsp. palearctica Y11]|uniref:Uncharacterized protein n=2 Tax=Yersinia enterocolitica TaxID=630 RepID=A0A0H3NMC5_YERE1|nr:unknown protein [Yersinia enterocolitica W22703]CBY25522.1 hypothetical protein Y11_26591 [Yersinia enterocolitica subsp. palearctica Y11]CCO69892.1 hypothetical protein D322_3035 [Yersinia enterocolitica IP 10393]
MRLRLVLTGRFLLSRPYFLSDFINALLQIIICKTEQHPAQS